MLQNVTNRPGRLLSAAKRTTVMQFTAKLRSAGGFVTFCMTRARAGGNSAVGWGGAPAQTIYPREGAAGV